MTLCRKPTVLAALATLLAVLVLCAAALAGFAGPAAAADSSPLLGNENDACFRCHGSPDQTGTIEVEGEQKSIAVDREVYEASRHGQLACASCHIGFEPGVHTPEQTEGWLRTAKLGSCRNCHADQFDMYRGSFHGDLVFGEDAAEAPLCADCHEAHSILTPGTPEFRASIVELCGSCHAEYAETYGNSYHGKAFTLGSTTTAVCTECHGGHRILPTSDRESMVSQQNIVATCASCHPGANENFAGFLVHNDPKDPRSSFAVWTFYALYIMLIAVVFTFGFVHSALYIYRGIKDGLYSRRGSHGG